MKKTFHSVHIFALIISLKDENIKLSERIIIPSNRLRGFQRGKVGQKMVMILLEEIMRLQLILHLLFHKSWKILKMLIF